MPFMLAIRDVLVVMIAQILLLPLELWSEHDRAGYAWWYQSDWRRQAAAQAREQC